MTQAAQVLRSYTDGPDQPSAGKQCATSPAVRSLILTLEVIDHEVVHALESYEEGPTRELYALAALRIGILALEQATGQLDAATIRDAGGQLIADVRELLAGRANQITTEVTGALKQYFDPSTGLVPQRLQALTAQDGEIDRLLRTHLGPEDSVVARTLADHLGEASPIFRMLSPHQTDGLRAQIEQVLITALAEQRTQVLREFSLDNTDSALSRLVAQIRTLQGTLKTDLSSQIDGLVREFSTDNDQSALSRLTRALKIASEQIGSNLTLDNEQSALSRLKRELTQTIDGLVQGNVQFQSEVREILAAFNARRDESRRSTTHGTPFERQVGDFLSIRAQRFGDCYEPTGNTTGVIKNCKKGDHVIALGPDSPAPGACIAFESKADKACDVRGALAYLDEAKKNRQAQVGVFVFSRRCAPAALQPFGRYGNDLVVVWDDENPVLDVFLEAAYSVARALTTRMLEDAEESEEALGKIDAATRAIEKQMGHLAEVRTWAETAENSGRKIKERVDKMSKSVAGEVALLDEQIRGLSRSVSVED
jgi:hypothetical protein